MNKLAPLLLLIVSVNVGLSANSNLRTKLAPIQWYSAGNGYGNSSVAYEDLNGDGNIDLARFVLVAQE